MQWETHKQTSIPQKSRIQPRFSFYFKLFTKGTCQQKSPSGNLLPIFSHNLRHFVLYRNGTYLLLDPHFSARRLAFSEKSVSWTKEKTAYGPT